MNEGVRVSVLDGDAGAAAHAWCERHDVSVVRNSDFENVPPPARWNVRWGSQGQGFHSSGETLPLAVERLQEHMAKHYHWCKMTPGVARLAALPILNAIAQALAGGPHAISARLAAREGDA